MFWLTLLSLTLIVMLSLVSYIRVIESFYGRVVSKNGLVVLCLYSVILSLQSMLVLNELILILLNIVIAQIVIYKVYTRSILEAYYFSLMYHLYLLTFRGIIAIGAKSCGMLNISFIGGSCVQQIIINFVGYVFLIGLIQCSYNKYLLPNIKKPLEIKKDRFYQLLKAYSSLSILTVINYVLLKSDDIILLELAIFVFVGVSIYNSSITFYLNSIDLTEMDAIKRHSTRIEKSIIKNEEYYKDYYKEIENFRYLEHDYKNLLNLFETMSNRNEISNIEKGNLYTEFKDEVNSLKYMKGIYSNNVILDLLLKEFSDICVRNRIVLEGRIVLPSSLKISTFELIRVITNIIENAIEANIKVGNSYKYIKITTKSQGTWLIISVENPYEKKYRDKNEFLKTDKLNTSKHGFGLKIVTQIVEKWDGIMTVEIEESTKTFKLIISVHL